MMLEGPGRKGVRRAAGWDGGVVFSSLSSWAVGDGGDSVRVADVALDEGPGGGEGLGGWLVGWDSIKLERYRPCTCWIGVCAPVRCWNWRWKIVHPQYLAGQSFIAHPYQMASHLSQPSNPISTTNPPSLAPTSPNNRPRWSAPNAKSSRSPPPSPPLGSRRRVRCTTAPPPALKPLPPVASENPPPRP